MYAEDRLRFSKATASGPQTPMGCQSQAYERLAPARAGDNRGTVPADEDDPIVRSHLKLLENIGAANRKAEYGRPEDAILDYQRLLKEHPSQPGLWFALASARLEQHETEEAIVCLERAVALRPAFAPYLLYLGEAYRSAGRVKDAVEALSKAIRIDPRSSESLLFLAIASFQVGDMDAGKIWLARSIRAAVWRLKNHIAVRANSAFFLAIFGLAGFFVPGDGPPPFQAARRLAGIHLRRGHFAEAEKLFRAALDDVPRDFDSLLGLGRSLLENGQALESLSYLRRAAALEPENAQALTELGTAYFRRAEIEAAFETLQTALRLDADAPRANRFMGWTLLRLERPEAAIEHFKRCLEGDPRCADAAFGISQSFENMGDFEQSNKWLQRTLEIDPHHAGSLLLLVESDKAKRGSATLSVAETILAKEGTSVEDRVYAHFAAGMIEDHLGDIERAFEHYEAANSLKDVTCDIEALSAMARRLREIFTRVYFEERRHFGVADERPIFIVGMPRSGSTLVEQILASHPEVTGGGELFHFPKHLRAFRRRCPPDTLDPDYLRLLDEQETRSIAEGYLKDLEGIGPESRRITDKMLSNFWNLGVIALAFPNARIIHTMRDPLDCCTSLYLRDFGGLHQYAYNYTNLGCYYRIYQRLMDHWCAVLPLEILEVQYESMVTEPLAAMRQIVAYCGLDWHDSCQTFYKTQRSVSTSSNVQVRQPIYGTAVGKWKRYERHLGALRSALSGEPSDSQITGVPGHDARPRGATQ